MTEIVRINVVDDRSLSHPVSAAVASTIGYYDTLALLHSLNSLTFCGGLLLSSIFIQL